ncbi:hypothetical protein J7438_17090 [Thalassotalea sp. G20_0]|uniref:hypothetical protein n=1 Tax=Thalassotalea sp. G20_0 TaxID=2821093 RepID=UPI001ADB0987|nr:hypothetical protein [Thalassotalea sp. G20_0]MBO9495791.1 hypothetical protein [Thalassotalea sp. G20_0]
MLVRCVPKSDPEIHHLMDQHGNFASCPASAKLEQDPRHKPIPLKKPNLHDNQPGDYLEAKLASDAVGFFLLTCNGPGYTVIPLNPGKRLYLVDQHSGYPPGLDQMIRTLQERDIWVVRSWLDVTRRVDAMADPNEKRAKYQARWYKEIASPGEKAITNHENHWHPGRYSLPNTVEERYQTFTEHHSESELCRLLLENPELLSHYVDEGLFFSGNYPCHAHGAVLQAQAAAPEVTEFDERLTCAFCMKNSRFASPRTTEVRQKKTENPIEDENILRTYLTKGQLSGWRLHDPGCLNTLYRGKPLVQVIDAEGNVRAHQMYFIADPVHESRSKVANSRDRSCPYVRTFVLDHHDRQKTGPLFVSYREVTEIIHRENNRKLGEMINDSALWVSTALESRKRLEPPESLLAFTKFKEKLKEATEVYKKQYASSALCLELETYKTLWQQLPAPLSPTEQAVSDFLVKANKKFCQLYTWSHLISELILLNKNTDSNLHCVLEPIIQKLALRRLRARDYLHQSIIKHSPPPHPAWPLSMTRLATPFSWEKLQSTDPCFRQISERGTEILVQLQKLTFKNISQGR